jgi:hypothetical protein
VRIYDPVIFLRQGYAQKADSTLRRFALPSITTGVLPVEEPDAQKSFPAYVLKTDAPLPEGLLVRRRLSANEFIVSVSDPSVKKILQKNAKLFAPANNLWKLSAELLRDLPDGRSTKWISLLVKVFRNRSVRKTISRC